ncbi:MAG: helix-turn-helix transcriptional regulator [Bacteroidales bacterium]|nr:helix-turn-helix transcriptional regulator [Bacteroidales bacterium]MCM1147891.1 helix-turn-helix transcriptional regulator [Bacteroidales bacterium]MCM1206734.1 helix-turn-helix transcriptional regulator [Bacillota bacterium]
MTQFCDRLSQLLTGQGLWLQQLYVLPLARLIGKNEATVSRWCSNKMQPSLDMLVKIAGLLKVDPRQLINGGK